MTDRKVFPRTPSDCGVNRLLGDAVLDTKDAKHSAVDLLRSDLTNVRLREFCRWISDTSFGWRDFVCAIKPHAPAMAYVFEPGHILKVGQRSVGFDAINVVDIEARRFGPEERLSDEDVDESVLDFPWSSEGNFGVGALTSRGLQDAAGDGALVAMYAAYASQVGDFVEAFPCCYGSPVFSGGNLIEHLEPPIPGVTGRAVGAAPSLYFTTHHEKPLAQGPFILEEAGYVA